MPATDAATTSVRPLEASPGHLRLLDQRRLPEREVFLDCPDAASAAEAIRSLAVRGAPLIGVTAAWALAVEARRVLATDPDGLDRALRDADVLLRATRPTAVNLAAALDRMAATHALTAGAPAAARVERLEAEAEMIEAEDRSACEAIGTLGAAFLAQRLGLSEGADVRILTHCNAGALATAGIGTALGVVRAAAARFRVAVLADETRPFWQGARLTAWELMKDKIDVTVLPDVAAAATIASGTVAAAVVGADRIAANGDVANKVGTYGVALACRAAGIPFVVAAPTTTLDMACPSGAAIPIEWRDGEEVLRLDPSGVSPLRVAPPGAKALYPAFDVTPAALVDAIVTEKGVATPPYGPRLAALAGR